MRIVIALLVCALAGCARQEPTEQAGQPAAPVSTHIPNAAQLEQFLEEGPEPTLRKIAVADYWLHYKLMQATGIEEALGGEAQAVSALKALGEAYERLARGAADDAPKMIRAAFTGEGMTSGLAGMSMGAFMGMMTTGLYAGLSDSDVAQLTERGPIRHSNDQGWYQVEFGKDGAISQSSEFEVNESGVNGKVKMKIRLDTCPDESGKVTLDVDVDSQMTMKGRDGAGGFVKSQMKYERWVDDDAKLIDTPEGSASNLRVNMGGIENFQRQSFDVTVGTERGGNRIMDVHDEQGFSIFRPEEVERTRKILDAVELLQTMVAEAMIRGLAKGPPWETGRCINLKVASTPGKRTGAAPSSTFDLEATPRAKSDGKPAGGTVTATLTGGAALQPAGGKVNADAKYQYTAPEKKNESASIKFESRSRRGVGYATLEFDTKRASAYSIEGGADEFHGTGVACSLEEQFFVEGSGVTVRFEPGSSQAGRYSYSGSMSGFRVFGNGTYTVSYQDGVATSMVATGPGSVVTPAGTFSNTDSEHYTLTPVESAQCAEPP